MKKRVRKKRTTFAEMMSNIKASKDEVMREDEMESQTGMDEQRILGACKENA